jgi:hypothetical protein
MAVFGFLFGFQFVAMLFHRGHTFMHYVGRAEHVPGWQPFDRKQQENNGAGKRSAGDPREQVNNSDNVAAGSQQTDIEDQQKEVNRMDNSAAGSQQPETEEPDLLCSPGSDMTAHGFMDSIV